VIEAITRARPRFAVPALKRSALGLMDLLGPAYARFGLGLSSLRFSGADRLAAALGDLAAGRARLVIAFRHPYGDEVPLWSGPLVRWLLPRTGSFPVYHVRLDRSGQVSYRSESLPRLERGALQLGFGVCDLGGNLFFTALGFYALNYLADTVGVAAATAGAVLMVGKIVDAFWDPILGYISDHAETRWDRRRPLILLVVAMIAGGGALRGHGPRPALSSRREDLRGHRGGGESGGRVRSMRRVNRVLTEY
jgi:hypothetical protein